MLSSLEPALYHFVKLTHLNVHTVLYVVSFLTEVIFHTIKNFTALYKAL